MPLAIKVPGAADSGKKFRPASATERKSDWTCPDCGYANKGSWTNCFGRGCNRRRSSAA